jgi:hypothetical protein
MGTAIVVSLESELVMTAGMIYPPTERNMIILV